MSAVAFLIFALAAIAAIPIAHALVLAAIGGIMVSDRVPLTLVVEQMVSQVQSFPLIAIPFFILTGALMMPVLPFLEDNPENITAIVTCAKEHGASYVLASFGMTLRDRQRAHYYAQLDRLFPGLRQQYERQYGARYSVAARGAARLEQVFREACERHSLATRMPFYEPAPPLQPALF